MFAFTAYFIFIIRRKDDKRRILVPDLSRNQLFMNSAPPPDQLTYRPTTYFHHEMTEVGWGGGRGMIVLLWRYEA